MVALILFIAVMGFTLGDRDKVSWPEKIVHDTVSFVQQIFYKPATAIANFFSDVANLRDTYEENEKLKIALAHYTRDKAWYNAVEAQNEQYKELFGFTERLNIELLRSLPLMWQTLIIRPLTLILGRRMELRLGCRLSPWRGLWG